MLEDISKYWINSLINRIDLTSELDQKNKIF